MVVADGARWHVNGHNICCAHTMSLHATRISNGLSFTIFDPFIWSGISCPLKMFSSIFFMTSKLWTHFKIWIYFCLSFRMWIETYQHCALNCAYQRFIFAMMSCTEYLHTAAGAIKSSTFSVLYCTLLYNENVTNGVVFSHYFFKESILKNWHL